MRTQQARISAELLRFLADSERREDLKGARADLFLELSSRKKAEAVYDALKPETDSSTGERSEVRIKLTQRQLQITAHAKDTNALRAAINSYLRWVSGCGDLTNVIDLWNSQHL